MVVGCCVVHDCLCDCLRGRVYIFVFDVLLLRDLLVLLLLVVACLLSVRVPVPVWCV